MRKSIKVHTEKAIREAIHLLRLAKKYKELCKGHKNEGLEPSLIIGFDNGYFTTVSGGGDMFEKFGTEKFWETTLVKITWLRTLLIQVNRKARLPYLPFDHCFSYEEKDVGQRMFSFYTNLFLLSCRDSLLPFLFCQSLFTKCGL